MKVLQEGHKYELESFEGSEPQTIQFIYKVAEGEALQTVTDGTTNEEVLDVLIDRLTYLNDKFPCDENENAIDHLLEAKMQLVKRTRDRIHRRVEGKALA